MVHMLKRFVRPAVNVLRRLASAWRRSRTAGPTGDQLTPESMLVAYLQGCFPLGRPSGRVDWDSLAERAVIAIDEVHVSKRLKTYLRKEAFEVRFDERFTDIVSGCADREETWINQPLAQAYNALHARGVAHSVEAYQDGQLVGGGYGLAIGRVFYLESMYCTVDHASKVAFIKLAERLKQDGFEWIDCQYLSEHWKRFGAKPMPREELIRHSVETLDCGRQFSQPIAMIDVGVEVDPVEEAELAAAGSC